MLERFKVPAQDQVRVPHESLHRTLSAIFAKMGEPPHNVDAAVDTLVTADLWGVESHGVSNMVKVYVERYGDGRIKADPQWRVLRETPATAVIDADRGLAVILGRTAMNLDVAAFTDLDRFKDNMDGVLKALREAEPAPGHDRVFYAGLSEYEHEQDRRANGIPLHSEVIEYFDHLAAELQVPRLERTTQ